MTGWRAGPHTVASLQTLYLQHKTSLKSFLHLLFSISLVCTFVLNLVNRETDDRHLHNFCFAQITKLSQKSKQEILYIYCHHTRQVYHLLIMSYCRFCVHTTVYFSSKSVGLSPKPFPFIAIKTHFKHSSN